MKTIPAEIILAEDPNINPPQLSPAHRSYSELSLSFLKNCSYLKLGRLIVFFWSCLMNTILDISENHSHPRNNQKILSVAQLLENVNSFVIIIITIFHHFLPFFNIFGRGVSHQQYFRHSQFFYAFYNC